MLIFCQGNLKSAYALSPLKHLHTIHLELPYDLSVHHEKCLEFASHIPTLRSFAVKQYHSVYETVPLDHYYIHRSYGDDQVRIIPDELGLDVTQVSVSAVWSVAVLCTC